MAETPQKAEKPQKKEKRDLYWVHVVIGFVLLWKMPEGEAE